MGRPAGMFDTRMTVLRRVEETRPAGNLRGGYAEVGTLWAAASLDPGFRREAAGSLADMAEALVSIRDSGFARAITIADRVRLRGSEYAILGVAPADRRGGVITLRISRQPG